MVAVLTVPLLAGCLGWDDTPLNVPPTQAPALAYVPVDEANLTEPVYDILEAVDTRTAASTDGTSLFAEVYLPDGEGPWPTIPHREGCVALARIVHAGRGSGDER